MDPKARCGGRVGAVGQAQRRTAGDFLMTNVEKKGNCPYHALEFASKVATLKKRFTRELFEPIDFGTVRPAPPPAVRIPVG